MGDAARRCTGAILGGGVGAVAYWIARERSVHLLAVLGAGLAVGAGWLATRRSLAWGLATCIAAPAFTVGVAWLMSPGRDSSVTQFISQLSRNSILSLVAVAGLGLYFGMGRNPKRPADPV